MAGTIQEIAEMAGVSRGTVDRALNNRGRINPEVAEKIFRIADEIGYVPKKKKQAPVEKTFKLGVVTQLAGASFMVQIKKGIKEAKKELSNVGIEILVEDCMAVDEDEQLNALKKLEEQGISGIAIMPVECDGVRKKINALIEKGIPVLTFNTDIVGTKRSCFIGLDNKQSGRAAAGLMGMLTGGSGKVVAITGYFGNSVNSMRVDGFIEETKRMYPEMELVGVQVSFDQKAEVKKIICSTLQNFPELNGIVVFSGGQAGIAEALGELNLKKRPAIVVYDVTDDNIKALKENTVDFLIDQNGFMQGYRSLFTLANIVRDGKKARKEYLYMDIVIKTKYNY